MIKKFTDLRIWQLAHELTLKIYKLSKNFPKEEVYGIGSQVRRSASSVGANIAEGFSRNTKKEYVQFLYVARGSLTETINHLILIKDLGHCNKELFESLNSEYEILSKQINSLISIIKKDYEK